MNKKLHNEILWVMDDTDHPMFVIYQICDRLGYKQHTSSEDFYRKVYRALEQLAEDDQVWVARGTRDPSVYLSKSVIRKS